MKAFFTSVLILSGLVQVWSQSFYAPDTIFSQHFEVDPSDEMLSFPSGEDDVWVNFNQDGGITTCAQNFGLTPGDWYYESDLGTNEPTNNSCFTSCSFRNGIYLQNRNWLITPPVYISDESCHLSWKSLALQGPLYMDGYKVLISNGSNSPLDNEYDTVFVAAQMVSTDSAGSLDLSQYEFSPGYIHANSFTDTNYYYIDSTELSDGTLAPYFHGRLEPHSINLAQYVGQSVYIAFLHDSRDDYILQIDDIAVVKEALGVSETHPGVRTFDLSPNPATDHIQINWELDASETVRITLMNSSGAVLSEKQTAEDGARLDLGNLYSGVYFLQLKTAQGQSTRRFVKI